MCLVHPRVAGGADDAPYSCLLFFAVLSKWPGAAGGKRSRIDPVRILFLVRDRRAEPWPHTVPAIGVNEHAVRAAGFLHV